MASIVGMATVDGHVCAFHDGVIVDESHVLPRSNDAVKDWEDSVNNIRLHVVGVRFKQWRWDHNVDLGLAG